MSFNRRNLVPDVDAGVVVVVRKDSLGLVVVSSSDGGGGRELLFRLELVLSLDAASRLLSTKSDDETWRRRVGCLIDARRVAGSLPSYC